MQPKSPKLLDDVCDAAAFILQASAGKTLQDFESDRLLRQALERNLEIIGEAIGRLVKLDPEVATQIGDYRQIIAFRNILFMDTTSLIAQEFGR